MSRRPTPAWSRAVTGLSRVALGAYFRAVEVQRQLPGETSVGDPFGTARTAARVGGRPTTLDGGPGPTLIVANHANGLLDPAVVVHAVGSLPRFVAKAGLWDVPGLGALLDHLGVLPVVRRQDRAQQRASNADTFALAQRALADGATVAIFPEGTAHDEPHLLPLRTGAARLALGARADGAEGLRIVPIGLVFDDKLALRSRALAVVGAPLDLDRWVAERGEPTVDDADRAAVEDLTAVIARRLGEVVPSAESAPEAWSLSAAAEVVARERQRSSSSSLPSRGRLRLVAEDGREPRLSAAMQVRRQLDGAPEAARQRVRQASDAYRRALELAGLSDDDLVSDEPVGHLVRRGALSVLRTVGLAPWAVFGAVVNTTPYLLVRGVAALARKPAAGGTLRLVTGIVAFPASWVTAGLALGRGRPRWVAVAVGVAAAASGYATVLEFERYAAVRRAWRGRTVRLGLRRRVDDLLDSRRQLLEATEAALSGQRESVPGERTR